MKQKIKGNTWAWWPCNINGRTDSSAFTHNGRLVAAIRTVPHGHESTHRLEMLRDISDMAMIRIVETFRNRHIFVNVSFVDNLSGYCGDKGWDSTAGEK